MCLDIFTAHPFNTHQPKHKVNTRLLSSCFLFSNFDILFILLDLKFACRGGWINFPIDLNFGKYFRNRKLHANKCKHFSIMIAIWGIVLLVFISIYLSIILANPFWVKVSIVWNIYWNWENLVSHSIVASFFRFIFGVSCLPLPDDMSNVSSTTISVPINLI